MASGATVAERRSGYRVQLQLPVRIATDSDTWADAETREVSAGGFLLSSSVKLAAGNTIQYIVCVPNFRSAKLHCTGRVLRTMSRDDGRVDAAVTMEECLSFDADV